MKLIHFETISSTNQYLKDNYSNLDNLTCVWANHQTNGRGRFGRNWVDNDDLLFSILIKNENNNLSNPTDYSLLIAATIYKVFKKMNLESFVKWPNDIIINSKKAVGILLEAVTTNEIQCVIIGIGINVNSKYFPIELIDKATSLKNELAFDVNKEKLLSNILNEFEVDYNSYLKNENDYLKIIRNNFYLKNKEVVFSYEKKEYQGIVLDIDEKGLLVVKTSEKILYLNSGEVTLQKSYSNKKA